MLSFGIVAQSRPKASPNAMHVQSLNRHFESMVRVIEKSDHSSSGIVVFESGRDWSMSARQRWTDSGVSWQSRQGSDKNQLRHNAHPVFLASGYQ